MGGGGGPHLGVLDRFALAKRGLLQERAGDGRGPNLVIGG